MSFRTFESEDLPALAALTADPGTMRFVGEGRPLSTDETAAWIEASRRNVQRHGYGTGAVLFEGRLIGWGGLARPEGEPEELIYGLGPRWWGRGLGLELARGLTRWALGDLDLAQIRATVHPDNAPSAAILQRLGYRVVSRRLDGDDPSVLFVLSKGAAPSP
ncbi:GNAT family N-acetyltransferase [Phenylobacterium deserti]|uniref:GNAT family N-acetyltransferase n=1 Tax=Phenylobacterium deserti TaxID=1914756 RepID=UPI001403FE3B|nr:GNAT family N-acetyltransferase [Phenylobacterium deserti]